MRKIILVLGMIIFLCRPAAAMIKTANLTAAWRLEGNANDWSGNGKNGTVTGAVVVAGKFGRGYSFDGVDDNINIGNLGVFYPKGTISFWMNPSVVENYRNPFTTKYNGVNAGIRFEEATVGSFVAVIGNDLGTYAGYYYLSTGLSAGTWYHVVLTWDTTLNKVIGYLNGEEKFNASHTLWPTTMPDVDIGNGYNSTRYWKGLIDEVRIFNRTLNAAEIRALMLNYDPGEF